MRRTANAWTREQQLIALRLYLTEPFGRLHRSNPLIVELASEMGRTPSALAMKACNFASLDPTFRDSGRVGLSGASEADRKLWLEYASTERRAQLIDEVEPRVEPVLERIGRELPRGDDEVLATVRVRRHQRFFRDEALSSYGGRCALSDLNVPSLLVASHIIPWAENAERRLDPRNGILLNALLDRAFDRGLIGFDNQLRMICSARLRMRTLAGTEAIVSFEGKTLRVPERTPPDLDALRWHRERWDLAA